jgi:protein-tyrosine phosphatase
MPPTEPVVRVLFVCTGNTCRSPLAAAALREALGPDAAHVDVSSAGTAAWEGQPASEGTRDTAARAGIDLSAHRSRRINPSLVQAADFVFVMEPLHRVALEAVDAPGERVHVLSEYPEPGEPGLPVSDPFGASREAYEECWRRIRLHVRRITPVVRDALRARLAS